MGAPDFVIYRTDLWDLQPRTGIVKKDKEVLHGYVNETDEVVHALETVDQYTKDHLRARGLIKSLLPDALVGSHTIPMVTRG